MPCAGGFWGSMDGSRVLGQQRKPEKSRVLLGNGEFWVLKKAALGQGELFLEVMGP